MSESLLRLVQNEQEVSSGLPRLPPFEFLPEGNDDASEYEVQSLQRVAGGGTSGGMSDDWKVSVDRQLEQLHGDVRNLLYGLIGGVLLLAGAGWSAYSSLAGQLIEVRKDVADVKVSAARLDGKLDLILARLSSGSETQTNARK